MASTAGVSSSLAPEVLNRHNYKQWRLWMKAYLLDEDLWEAVEEMEPAKLEDDETKYKSWREKNVIKALYAIRTSCRPEMFQFIRDADTAKSAWDALERVVPISTGRVENSAENFEPYIEFTKFISEGDWEKAKECLKLKDLDLHDAIRAIDSRDQYGNRAIHLAAREGHVNIVKELVRLMTEEDLKMKNAKGLTALHVAVIGGQLQTAKELVLLMGGEICPVGFTALHFAVSFNKPNILKELVQYMRRNDLKIKNKRGYTALHIAVGEGNVAMVKDLAPLMGEVRGPRGDTALHLAVRLGAAKAVKELLLLMRREELAMKNDDGYTALHLAVKEGNAPVVKEFMPKEKEPDLDSSYSQFTEFVMKGEWDNAKACLAKLDDPCDAITIMDPIYVLDDPRDAITVVDLGYGYGYIALHVAARDGCADIVKEMISLLKVRQDNLELKTLNDVIAFGSAINLGVTEEVFMEKAKYMVQQYDKLLIGILNLQTKQGSTALHLAAFYGNLDIVKELMPLMSKEGLEKQDADGYTPLITAAAEGHMDIVKELVPMMRQKGLELKSAKTGGNAVHFAIMNKHINVAKEVMSYMRKEALEEKDGEGYTALGRAIDVCNDDDDVMEIAKYMAEKYLASGCLELIGFQW